MTTQTHQFLQALGRHLVQCLDGAKAPPRWLHRSHRLSHFAYLATAALGFAGLHERVVVLLCFLSAGMLVLGNERVDLEDGE